MTNSEAAKHGGRHKAKKKAKQGQGGAVAVTVHFRHREFKAARVRLVIDGVDSPNKHVGARVKVVVTVA